MTVPAAKRWAVAAALSAVALSCASRAYATVVMSDDGMYAIDLGANAKMMTGVSHETAAPDAPNAERIGEEAAEVLRTSLPPGARVVPSSSKIAWGKNVPVVRTTVNVEGLPAGQPASARELLTAVGSRTLYVAVWSGTPDEAAELARAADHAAPTTDLKPEARPFRALNPWPGRVLFFFGVGGLILLRVRMKKSAAVRKSNASRR
jgi:hypothetical protein